MVTTIAPAVFAGNRKKWTMAAVIFVAGGALGGAATGMALSGIGQVTFATGSMRRAAWLMLVVGALGYAFHERGFWQLPVPSLHRQVPRGWRSRFPLPVVALLYSVDLGAGILTQITTASLYVLCLALVALGEPVKGILLMGCYGMVRSLTTMAFSAGLDTMDAAIIRSQTMIPWRPVLRSLSAIALLVVAGTCGIQILGGQL